MIQNCGVVYYIYKDKPHQPLLSVMQSEFIQNGYSDQVFILDERFSQVALAALQQKNECSLRTYAQLIYSYNSYALQCLDECFNHKLKEPKMT